MTFPTVAGTPATGRTSTSDTTSHAITLPSGITAGEHLVVVFSCDGAPATLIPSTQGWSRIGQARNGSTVTSAVFWKVATGDANDALTITTDASEQSSHISYRIADAGWIVAVSSNGSSTNSDPPNLTPPFGAQDYLWIAARSGDSTTNATVAPTNFSSLTTIDAAGTGGASTATAVRSVNDSSQNPGTFTSGDEQWVAWTIACIPEGMDGVQVRGVTSSNNNDTTSTVVRRPAGVVDGDVLVAIFTADPDGSISDLSAPGGWTQIGGDGQSGAAPRGRVFYRVASSEGSSWTFGGGTSSNSQCTVIAFYQCDTADPFVTDPTWNYHTSGVTSVVAPTVSPADAGTLVTVHSSINQTLWSAPSGMVELFSGTTGAWTSHGVYFEPRSSGATGTRTAVQSTSGVALGISTVMRPGVTFSEITGTVAATLGSLTASVAGVRATAGTVSASLGALTAAVEGTGTPPPLEATATLGALTATVTGTRTTSGSVSVSLGGLSASSGGVRVVLGSVAASLGGLTATMSGRTTVDITALSRATVTQRTRHELWCVARIVSSGGPPTLIDVDPIEWSGLSWTDELSRPQTLQAAVAITSLPESIRQRLRDMANQPSELHLYRNGRLVFAGPWIGALVQGETLTMQAIGLLGYLRYREIGITQTFTQVDQAQIVKTLIDQAQADARGHWGLDTSGIVDTGQVRDATYRIIDGNNLAQRIEEMGRRDFGFDIEVDPRTRQVLLWHPRKGVDRSEGEGSIVFDARNVTDPTVSFSVAPGDVATRTVAVGTSDKDPVLGVALNLELGARFGLADYAERFDGVSEQLTIDDHAWSMLEARDQALVIPGPDVRVDADTDLDLWTVGDTITYEVNDELGIRGAWRVRKRTVKVDSSGQETVTPEFV